MKKLKSLIACFALVCLLSAASSASNGTISSGGDRTSVSPTPAPAPVQSEPRLVLDTTPETAPGADDGAELTFDDVRGAMLWLASWVIW